ncbi:MAG: AraC family transcriptional regulator [Pseudoxanthomonas sp.]
MKVDFRSEDPSEIQHFLESVYTGNRFRFHDSDLGASSTIVGDQYAGLAVYDVLYSSPFEFLSEGDRESFLIVTGTEGEGLFRRGRQQFRCEKGAGGIVSSAGESRVTGGQCLGHISVHIDTAQLQEHCQRWLGTTLDESLVFEQSPMSGDLLKHWNQAIGGMQMLSRMEWCPDIALQALNEHIMSLLLTMHPHNFTSYLHRGTRFSKKKVQEAKWLLEHSDSALTEGLLAQRMGYSIPEVVMGFALHELPGTLDRLLRATWTQREQEQADKQPLSMRAHTAGPMNGCLSSSQCAEVENYIARHLADCISVGDLASIAKISAHHFILLFRRTYGTTPGQYLIRLRIERAKRLLEETSLSIASIAAEVGFSSHSHLSDQFARRTGLSPSEYRRRRSS